MRGGCESESERVLVAVGKWEKGRMCVILGGGWWYAGVKIGKHRCFCLFVPFRGETHERCCRSILRARTKARLSFRKWLSGLLVRDSTRRE